MGHIYVIHCNSYVLKALSLQVVVVVLVVVVVVIVVVVVSVNYVK